MKLKLNNLKKIIGLRYPKMRQKRKAIKRRDLS
jgi:hypothetical protein